MHKIYIFVFTFLILIVVASAIAFGQLSNIDIKNYSDADGLSSNSGWHIVQDSAGFIWFGTEDGLNRFDGYSFKAFRKKDNDTNTINGNHIDALWTDHNNNLWIKTNNGVFNKMNLATGKVKRYVHTLEPFGIPIDSISCFFIDSKNNFWIGTYHSGIYRSLLHKNAKEEDEFDAPEHLSVPLSPSHQEEEAGSVRRTMNSSTEAHATFFREDNSGNIWIIYIYKDDKIYNLYRVLKPDEHNKRKIVKAIIAGYDPGNSKILSIAEDLQNNYWIVTDRELVLYHPQKGILKKWKEWFDLYPAETITMIGKEEVWISNHNKLYCISLPTLKLDTLMHDIRDPNSPLFHCDAGNIYLDKQGILWSAGNSGLSKLVPSSKKIFHSSLSIGDLRFHDNRVRSISYDNKNTVWIGSAESGLWSYDIITKKYTHFDILTGSNKEPWALLCDNNNKIWMHAGANDEGGLLYFDPVSGQKHLYKHDPADPNSLCGNSIKALVQNKNGEIWIGASGGLNRLDLTTNKMWSYTFSEWDSVCPVKLNLKNRLIKCITFDSANVMWIGTEGAGFYRFHYNGENKEPDVIRYDVGNNHCVDIGGNWVCTICKAKNGLVWLGTYGGGLSRFNPVTREFKTYLESDGLPNNVVYAIFEDAHGHLWMSSNKGICEFDPVNETFKTFDVNDGVQANEFNNGAYYKSKNGTMLFGGINGWNMFHPDNIRYNDYEPNVVFTDFQVFNKHVVPGENSILKKDINYIGEITLQPEQNIFSFEFAALNFSGTAKNQYRYILEGYDKVWQSIGTRRFISFTNLDPGKYVLKVQGSNNDGLWSRHIKTLKITILPKYYQTAWFRVLFIVFIGGITFSIFYLFLYFKRIRVAEQLKIREQIKKDLHDDLKSDIAAIQNNADLVGRLVDRMDKEKIKNKANEISELSQTALSTVDDLSWAFSPAADSADALFAKMKDFVVAIMPDEINYSIESPVEKINLDLPFKARKHFYLIFKECLYNLKKHSQCRNAAIKWKMKDNLLTLEIKDDGKGFDINTLSRKNGLLHIQERAKEINGKFQIESSPGKGTRIMLEIHTT